MKMFYLFVSVIIGCIITVSPVAGLFFYAILLYSVHIKNGSLPFKCLLTLLAVLSAMYYKAPDTQLDGGHLTHVVIEDYKYYTDSLQYIVSSSGKTYELYDESGEHRLLIGSVCSGSLPVTVPGEQRNFIKQDGQAALRINGVSGRIYLSSTDFLDCHPGTLSLSQYFSIIRYQYMSKMLESTKHDYKFDLLTLSVGNKNYISPEFFDALQKLGIYHLYVISGTHVAFLSAVIFGVLKFLRVPLNSIKLVIITSLLVFLFLNFLSPSVLRAVFMGVLLLICSFFKKKPYLAIISLSALVQLAVNPHIIFHAGFQLSYITTYIILLTRPLFIHYSAPVQLILVTVISELSTLVIVLIHFNEISLSGLLLNIIFIPFFSFIIFPGVIIYNLLLFLNMTSVVDGFYHVLFGTMKDCIYYISETFKHRLPVKNLTPAAVIILLVLTYSIMVNILLLNIKKTGLAIVIFIAVIMISQKTWNNDYTLTMTDVGQGDAFVIQDHQSGKTVLLDTGGKFQHKEQGISLSDKTLLPYLKEQGIDFIDVMIISHLDLDHSGEVLHILDNIQTGSIVMNTEDVKFDEWAVNLKASDRVKIHNSSAAGDFTLGNMYFENLTADTAADSNEQSVVLKVHLGEFSVLFTGDIGLVTEENLVKKYNLKSDILKVGHHGSDTSSGEEFINEVDADIALISAGVNNRYNHPHDTVIKTLSGSRIISTKEKGMVEFSINHDTICIRAKLDAANDQCLKKGIKKEPDNRPD